MTELVDNDILLKAACYGTLFDLMAANCESMPVGYLTVAKFVLSKKLKKMTLRGERAQAELTLSTFFSEHESVETTPEEAELASELEAAAQARALPLDTGESQLLAILVVREMAAILTGDKRAIAATERLLDYVPILATVAGKIKCFEQLVKRMLEAKGLDATRRPVCREPEVDRTLTICVQCLNPSLKVEDVLIALDSYINDLRKNSPRVLSI